MRLLFKNIRWYSDNDDHLGDIRIGKGRVLETGADLKSRRGERALDASGYLAIPGLVNAHDHLDLNLFSHLGNPPYENFYEWGEEIYRPNESPVRDILGVPHGDRLLWGAYKQLISGVTTVVHHDPWYRRHFDRRFPVKVLRRYGWAHSLGHTDDIAERFAGSRGLPFIVHAAEGIDASSSAEIDTLDRIGVLSAKTVLVHGIAVTPDQIDVLAKRGVSIVWCPASNMHLYGQTAPISGLMPATRVALGTDATLSGSPTLWDELRSARSTGMATDGDLIDMVTTTPADVFGLEDGCGTLRPGGPGDMVLLPDNSRGATDQILQATPSSVSLVLIDGQPRVADPDWSRQLELGEADVFVGGVRRWLFGEFNVLRHRISRAIDPDILADNELWREFDQTVPVS